MFLRSFLVVTSLTFAGAAKAEAPVVVTDIPVVQSLVASVMEGVGTPTSLVTGGAEPHDFQLRPSQARVLENADLLVWIGPEMTPWLERATESLHPKSALALLGLPETIIRPIGDEHDDHGHEGADPHAWLLPTNAATWTGIIAEALADIDPANAAAYRANAAESLTRIAALEAELQDTLAPAKGRPLIVSHDAFGYLADRFDLDIRAIAASDAATPGAGHLAEIAAGLTETTCIFPEAGAPDTYVSALAAGHDVHVGAPLDPEGTGIEPGPGGYEALMRALAASIASCAGD